MVPNEQDQGWAFAGRLNPDRHMQALEYWRILLPGVTGPQQVNMWLVKLETLSALSDAYLTDHLALLASIKLSTEQTREFADERLERSFNHQRECPQYRADELELISW